MIWGTIQGALNKSPVTCIQDDRVIVQLVCHVPFLWDGFSRTLEIKTSTHDVTSTQNYTAPKNSTIDWAEHNQ